MEEEKFKYLLLCAKDLAIDLLYYDRKECEEVTVEDCETLTQEQKEEIVKVFKDTMLQ